MRKRRIGRWLLTALLLLLMPGIAGTLDARADGWKFGDQLSGKEKEIYEVMEENYFAIRNCNEVNGATLQLANPLTAAESQSLQWLRVQRAFLLDHSELFWISVLTAELNMEWDAADGIYRASRMTVFTTDRYPGIRSEIADAQAELDRAIAAVGRYSGRYAKAKASHDYVIRLTSYPQDLMSEYYHAVTGPLLGKYGHSGVCEAYAWLFDILCKANGVPSVILEGSNHAWNYVQLEDGKWYLVDTTWDDVGKIAYDYFLVGSDTKAGGKKIKKTHAESATRSLYELNGITPLGYPALSKKAYKGSESQAQKVTSVRIVSPAKQVKAGKTLALKATVLPDFASNKKLKWSSSNTKYATVTGKGVVKTKKAGKGRTVRITAKARDGSGKKATIKIRIR